MIKVKDCWDLYLRKHIPDTVNVRRNQGFWSNLCWFKDHDAEAITSKEVARYVGHRAPAMPSSVNRELGMLRACLRFAEQDGLIDKAPPIKALPKAATRVSALSRVQAQALLKAAEKRNVWQERAFLMLALGTGQRPGAIVGLTWGQIADDVIDFRSTDPKVARMKGRSIVPLNDLTRKGLKIAAKHRDGSLVLHHAGAPISRIQRLLHRVAREAGVPCTPHMLRHTVASTLLQEGVDLLPVSRLLGHANTLITQTVYFQHQPGWLKETVYKLDF